MLKTISALLLNQIQDVSFFSIKSLVRFYACCVHIYSTCVLSPCCRLIYWLCLFLDSNSFRAFGFSLSFLPILVMLGVNLYYVCSSMGQDAVFDVAPPTTPPSAPRRWWD